MSKQPVINTEKQLKAVTKKLEKLLNKHGLHADKKLVEKMKALANAILAYSSKKEKQ